MALTAEQRQLRSKYIGSSEIAAILGVDPRRSAADIYLDKTGRAEPFAGNKHTSRGNILEPAILNYAEMELGKPIRRDVMVIHPSDMIAANLDGVIEGEVPELVEAKSSIVGDEWGEEYTDQVPERVIMQTHFQFAVAGIQFRRAWVPVMLPGGFDFDFRMYQIHRDDELAAGIEQAAIDFQLKHILPGIPPEDFKPSIDIIKRVRRQPNKSVEISPKLLTAYVLAQQQAKAAEDLKQQAQRELLAALDDAEEGVCLGGRVTYFEQHRKEYTVAAGSYRTMRVSLPKSAK